jgi:predicted AlkP superfamily phosphohydrolase/phosphomutase
VDDALFSEVSLDTLEDDLFDVLDARIRFTKRAVEDHETDFLYVLVKTIDVFQHVFWIHMARDDPAYGDVIYEAYRRVDSFLGWLDERTDANLIVFSDHGFNARSERPSGLVDRVARAVDARVEVPSTVQRVYDRIAKSEVEISMARPEKTTGVHADPAGWFASGPDVQARGTAEVAFEDLTPTILALLGEPIPDDYVGDPVPGLAVEPVREDVPLETRRRLAIGDDEVVSERLHNLGYAEMVDE